MNSSSEITEGRAHGGKPERRILASIESSLVTCGYAALPNHKEQVFTNRAIIGGKQYITQLHVGKTIYDRPRKCDFFVVNRSKFSNDLIIECKWQASRGTVDEKYPYLFCNIIKTGIPTIIVLDGRGYKPAAMNWLRGQVNPENNLLAVWTLEEFAYHVDEGFFA
jgi:hypothetical protein